VLQFSAPKSKAIEKETTMEALVLSNLSFFTRSGVLKRLETARAPIAEISARDVHKARISTIVCSTPILYSDQKLNIVTITRTTARTAMTVLRSSGKRD
jgi:hypothetical protein